MKSRNFWGWLKVGVVVVVPLFVVLTLWGRNNTDRKSEPESVAASLAANPPEASAGDSDVSTVDEMEVDEPDPAEFASSTNAVPVEMVQPAAADVKLSDGALELVKMAQSGVDEQVMLAFVTGYVSKFNLGSEQIIYLNDLGVSGNVVRAMIERDAQLGVMVAQAAATNLPPGVLTNSYAENYPTNLYYPPTNYEEEPVVDAGYNTAPGYDTSGYVGGDDSYFYNSLQPYGSWVYVSGYGRCWQPTVCVGNRNWQPYCDRGKWVYTDCGWYWHSDYSWGWAPFHYGRWFCDDRVGWVWRPGRTWGPAWVSWRNSSDYCGWAPLPPEARWASGGGFRYSNRSVGVNFEFGLHANQYCFVPANRFYGFVPSRHRVGGAQVASIYNHTKVVNNFTVQDRHVVNNGIDPKLVAQASHTEIRKVTIKDVSAGSGKIGGADHLGRNGGSLAVLRPQLPPRPVVGDRTHGDGKGNDRGNGRNGNLPAGDPTPKVGGIAGKPVISKPTPGVPNNNRNPWPGRERDVVPPIRGGVVATPKPQQPEPMPAKTIDTRLGKEGATASAGQPVIAKPTGAVTPSAESERKDLPARSVVPIFTKREPAASPVGNAGASTSAQNNGNAGANHFVRPQTPSAIVPVGSALVGGRNVGNTAKDTYPANSLVVIGGKTGNDSGSPKPANGAPGLPNMNLANRALNPGPETAGNSQGQQGVGSSASQYYQSRTMPIGTQNGAATARIQTPVSGQVGANNASAVRAAQMEALMSRLQNANKPATAANVSPAAKDAPASTAPRWTMPAQSTTAPAAGGRAENRVAPASTYTAPAASSFHGGSTIPTPAPRPAYAPPVASAAQAAPTYHSAPVESRPAPGPTYSAPAQHSTPSSTPSRDTSSGSSSASGKSRP